MLPAATASAPGAKTRAAGEDAGSAWRSAVSAAVEAIQIDQQNQAAVGRDGGAGEKLDAAQIIAEILDDDFVLAENFFDDHDADLPSGDFHDDHVEIAVERLERRQGELQIEAHDLGDHVAHAGEQFSADVFDFVGLEAANFLDDSQAAERRPTCRSGRTRPAK